MASVEECIGERECKLYDEKLNSKVKLSLYRTFSKKVGFGFIKYLHGVSDAGSRLLHCKNSRVVLTLLWLSQLQNRYYCAAEVAIHAAKIHSLIHRHNYYAHETLRIRSWDSVYAHGTLCICFS